MYDSLGLRADAIPHLKARKVAESAALIVTSDSRRAIESAHRLTPNRTYEMNPLWREAPLPDLPLFGSIPLPAALNIGISRLAWYLGLAAGSESVAASRTRAALAAAELERRCRDHGNVLLIGHGMFNHLIAAVLRAHGWRGPRYVSAGYWATTTFEARAA